MNTPILLPELGVGPVTLSIWYADVGEAILQGERLVEVLVDGATFDLTSPATGRLHDKAAYAGEKLAPGQILGTMQSA